MNLKVPIENRHFARIFYLGFFVLFILFVLSSYTMVIVGSFICLLLAIGFKTWEILREIKDGQREIKNLLEQAFEE